MTDFERYVVEEHIEDFQDGLISRRELLRRVTLITGSLALSMALLEAAGCGPEPTGKVSPAPAAKGSPAVGYATPPPAQTTDGITVKPDDPRISAGPMTVQALDGASLIAYLATPKKQGRYPGVLVVHENRGLVEHIKDVVRRLATAGIVGLSIDLLSRQGGADKLSDPAAYAAALAKQPVASMITDLTATLVYLGRQSSVNRQALGTVGFCFGGGMVWSLVASDLPVKAAVPFYGPPPSDPGRLATTHVNVLAIYAELDTRITSSSGQVDEQLAKAGVAHKVTIYPGVNHAFHNDTGSRYAPVQAQQAWVATIEWFRKYLV